MPKSFISADYTAIIPANRNTVSISYKGENICLTVYGVKSVPEVNIYSTVSCRLSDINVSEHFTICPVIILFAYCQQNLINTLMFQSNIRL